MRGGTLFSGIGAPECAAPDVDWRWACEIDPFASAVHAARFPHIPNLGDVTAVDWSSVEPVDLIVAGPPCQDHSVAGKRAGLGGERGNLSLTYVDILDAINPAISLTENVPGWLSLGDNAFGAFLAKLVGADAPLVPARGQRWTDSGVVDGPKRTTAWRILDAQFFGVPQRRRRVFVLAVRGSGNWACAEALFPVAASVRRHPAPRRSEGERIAAKSLCSTNGGIDREGRHTLIAHSLRADGFDPGEDGTGRETPRVTHALNVSGRGGDVTEDGTGRGTPLIAVDWKNSAGGPNSEDTFMTLGVERTPAVMMTIIPIDMRQASRGGTITNSRAHGSGGAPGHGVGESDDPGFTVSERGQAVAICEGAHGVTEMDVATAVQQGGGKPGQGYPAVMFDPTARQPGWGINKPLKTDGPLAVAFDVFNQASGEMAHTLRVATDNGLQSAPHVHQSGMSVRRLLPVECERLMGFPDNWTAITYRAKPAADGPRYRSLGNSMAVPCVKWILMRLRDVPRQG